MGWSKEGGAGSKEEGMEKDDTAFGHPLRWRRLHVGPWCQDQGSQQLPLWPRPPALLLLPPVPTPPLGPSTPTEAGRIVRHHGYDPSKIKRADHPLTGEFVSKRGNLATSVRSWSASCRYAIVVHGRPLAFKNNHLRRLAVVFHILENLLGTSHRLHGDCDRVAVFTVREFLGDGQASVAAVAVPFRAVRHLARAGVCHRPGKIERTRVLHAYYLALHLLRRRRTRCGARHVELTTPVVEERPLAGGPLAAAQRIRAPTA